MRPSLRASHSPGLVLGLGILTASAVAVAIDDTSRAQAMLGPAILAIAILAASAIGRRLGATARGADRGLAIHAVSTLVAGGIVSLADPTAVATMMPILGGGAAVVLAGDRRRRRSCRSAGYST